MGRSTIYIDLIFFDNHDTMTSIGQVFSVGRLQPYWRLTGDRIR